MAKVTGKAKYAEDFRADGMLFAKLMLSPRPHARVVNIDASRALAMPGVHAILTADDLPPPPAPPAQGAPGCGRCRWRRREAGRSGWRRTRLLVPSRAANGPRRSRRPGDAAHRRRRAARAAAAADAAYSGGVLSRERGDVRGRADSRGRRGQRRTGGRRDRSDSRRLRTAATS